MPRIPYGTKYTVKVSGSIWKPVSCENCGCEYAYQVKHQTDGSATNVLWLNKDGAIRNAHANANQNLENYLKSAVRNYHCPACGCYQAEMIQRLKNNIWQRAVVFGVIAFVIVAFGMSSNASVLFYSVMTGLIVFIALLSPLLNFDPNAGAKSRIGQPFSESYPVQTREALEPMPADSIIERITPFAVELVQRISAGEEMEMVANSIAKRAGVSSQQVIAFAYTLARSMKEKSN